MTSTPPYYRRFHKLLWFSSYLLLLSNFCFPYACDAFLISPAEAAASGSVCAVRSGCSCRHRHGRATDVGTKQKHNTQQQEWIGMGIGTRASFHKAKYAHINDEGGDIESNSDDPVEMSFFMDQQQQQQQQLQLQLQKDQNQEMDNNKDDDYDEPITLAELAQLEETASRQIMQRLLLPNRIGGAITFVAQLFVVVGIFLNVNGYGYVIRDYNYGADTSIISSEDGGSSNRHNHIVHWIGIDTLENRQFQMELRKKN